MFPEKNYTLGRGKLYFDDGTGQRYIGNTPEISLTSEQESLEHFDSDNGVKQKDASILLSLARSGSFTTDHISPDNLAMFFLGSASVVTAASATAVVDNAIVNVKLGRRYQIGVTPSTPAGVRGITNVVVKVATVTKAPGTDYTLDEATGGIVPLVGGNIAEDDDLAITFDQTATSYNRVISGGSSTIVGSMLYIATNPEGEKLDYFWPKVELKPDGDYTLKGDDFQQISFQFEALKKDDNTEAVYINGRPGSGI
jgi:hypothetical protein